MRVLDDVLPGPDRVAAVLGFRLAEHLQQDTSGTTGFPKGATLTHHNILNNGFSIGELLGYTEHDRVVIPVPFYHCFGMVIGNLAALSHGAATIIPGRGFTPAAALEAVQDFGGTSLYGVPTMFIAELALPDFASYDLSTLRTGVMAGSLCPIEVMNRVISEMHMVDVAICYGMTETSPVSTMTRERRHPDSSGRKPWAEPCPCSKTRSSTLAPRGAPGARARSASWHPRVRRDEGLLGPAGQNRRSHRRRRLDAYR